MRRASSSLLARPVILSKRKIEKTEISKIHDVDKKDMARIPNQAPKKLVGLVPLVHDAIAVVFFAKFY